MLDASPITRGGIWLFSAATAATKLTPVVLNLAITAVLRASLRVVAVDANPQNHALAEQLGLASSPGLAEVRRGECSLDRALQETGIAYLHALAAGQPDARGMKHSAGENMTTLLDELRQRFDAILIDGPCWDGRPEVVALGALCDSLYLVVSHADAESESVGELQRVIPEYGGPLRGCVVTPS
jgi:Mrp family chromosome partitioning ATPase